MTSAKAEGYTAERGFSGTDRASHIYNYCYMPHVAKETYMLPSAMLNNSVDAQLILVQVIQRHHKRTPYNLPPTQALGDDWDCGDISLFGYGYYQHDRFSRKHRSVWTYQQTYSSHINPFSDRVQGTCQFPQLTGGGLLDAQRHGRDLRNVYQSRLKLSMPSKRGHIDAQPAFFRYSRAALTEATAAGVLAGLFDTVDYVPLHAQNNLVDSMDGGYPCPAADRYEEAKRQTPAWQEHLDKTADLRARLEAVLSTDTSDDAEAWRESFDHYADYFQGRQCHGLPLPCHPSNTSLCVTQADIDTVSSLGDWEWDFTWRAQPNAKQHIRAARGVLIAEMLDMLSRKAAGQTKIRYAHLFGHDGELGPLLGSLGVPFLRWPGMGAEIVFELYKTKADAHMVRVLYGGRPIRSSHGDLSWMPLDQFAAIWQTYIPEDAKKMCV
jgi:acid phosphatase